GICQVSLGRGIALDGFSRRSLHSNMVPRHARGPRKTAFLALLALAPLLLGASFSVAELTKSADRIFRGRCVSAWTTTVDFKGSPLAATAYTFEVSDYLKGGGPVRFTFSQAGTPDRGVSDLGRVAGLTVFVPGNEYVGFLRPISKAGLTSAAGRGRGG